MEKIENVIQGLECRKNFSGDCDTCRYHRKRRKVGKCASDKLMDDTVELLKWQQGEIERLTEQLEKGCDICSNKMLKEEQNDTGIRPYEMMITHNDGTVEYIADIDSVGLLASKHYDITYYGELKGPRGENKCE